MRRICTAVTLAFLLAVSSTAQNENKGFAADTTGCLQPRSDRDALIDEAMRHELITRRVEIAGSTYTRHREFVKRMVPGLNEGEIFTRAALEASVRRISRMKVIYPITIDDVEIKLDRAADSVDIIICVRQKRKR